MLEGAARLNATLCCRPCPAHTPAQGKFKPGAIAASQANFGALVTMVAQVVLGNIYARYNVDGKGTGAPFAACTAFLLGAQALL